MAGNMTDQGHRPNSESALEAWKQIAAYLQRDVKTVIRWEKSEGLPVHRHHHFSRSSVYAYPSELDAWRAARERDVRAEPVPLWRRPLPSAALAGLLLLSLITVGNGSFGGRVMAARITVRHVWSGYATSPSYDGRFLAYTDSGDVWVRDLRSGENRRLTNHDMTGDSWGAKISREGTQVAYTFNDYKTDLPELRVVGLDGSAPRILIPLGEYEWPLWVSDWSPDGKRLLVLAGKGEASWLLLVGAADGAIRELRALETRGSLTAIQFSPDGRYIAYDKGRGGDIYVFAADGGSEMPLVRHPAADSLLGWAPDGSGILFASDRTDSRAAWFLPVSEGRPQGDPRHVKADFPVDFDSLGMTQDGRYYFRDDVFTMQAYFATLDPSTGEIISPPAKAPLGVMGSIMNTTWSPDGRRIAYMGRDSAGGAVRIHDLETGQERRLVDMKKLGELGARSTTVATASQGGRFPLRWSPDGQSLLLVLHSEDREYSVYQLDTQTGGVRGSFGGYTGGPCAQSRWIDWADWSADGQGIYYVCYNTTTREGLLMYRDLRTGRDRRVSDFRGISLASLSPNRRRLAYRGEGGAIMVRQVEGGEPLELARPRLSSASSIAWMPDGRHLIVNIGGSGLWWVPLEGGEPRNLDIPMEGLGNVHAHPAEPQIVFTAGSREDQVWVMENFLPGSGGGK